MVDKGKILKKAPLPEVPNNEPPVAAFHHLITLPAEVALMFELTPQLIDEGVAITDERIGVPAIVTDIPLLLLIQEGAFQFIIICPLPLW